MSGRCSSSLIWSARTLGANGRGIAAWTVTDPSGAAVTKADVQITAPDGKIIKTVTSQTGSYDVKGLACRQVRNQSFGQRVFESTKSMESTLVRASRKRWTLRCRLRCSKKTSMCRTRRVGLDTSAESNATQMVLTGKDLDALSDDPDELSIDLAGAGGAIGGTEWRADLHRRIHRRASFRRSLRFVRFASTRIRFPPNTTSWATDVSRSSPSPEPTSITGRFSVMGNSSYFNSTSPFATSTPAYDSTQYTANFGGPDGQEGVVLH